jgi:shikimate dehydrogenase
VPLAVADVDDLLDSADALDLSGLSVTAPFKVDLLPRLAAIDADAVLAGAVNTLVRGPGGWHGGNSDLEGFLAGCAGLDLAGRRVAVLGTGGAARAVAVAARRAGAVVTCYGRHRERTGALSAALGVAGAPRPVAPGTWDVLVNATPVGTHPDVEASAFPEAVYDGRAVCDLVYNPETTRVLREAAASGCLTIGGLGMLVAQAQRQVERWTGRRPEAAPMREAAAWKLARQAEAS